MSVFFLMLGAPKGRFSWPSDGKQCGEAADQGRQAAGPSEQRAAGRSARSLLREAPKYPSCS